MRRLGYVVSALMMMTALTGGAASADDQWCAEDPVFNIRGTVFRLTTNIEASASDVTSISYDVTLPADAAGLTTVAYPQGKRLPTTVNITYAGTSTTTSYGVSATVTVSGPAGATVRVDLTGPSVSAQSWTGSTNSAVGASFSAAR